MTIEFEYAHNKHGVLEVSCMQMGLCIGKIIAGITLDKVYFDTHDCDPMINDIDDQEQILAKMKELQDQNLA